MKNPKKRTTMWNPKEFFFEGRPPFGRQELYFYGDFQVLLDKVDGPWEKFGLREKNIVIGLFNLSRMLLNAGKYYGAFRKDGYGSHFFLDGDLAVNVSHGGGGWKLDVISYDHPISTSFFNSVHFFEVFDGFPPTPYRAGMEREIMKATQPPVRPWITEDENDYIIDCGAPPPVRGSYAEKEYQPPNLFRDVIRISKDLAIGKARIEAMITRVQHPGQTKGPWPTVREVQKYLAGKSLYPVHLGTFLRGLPKYIPDRLKTGWTIFSSVYFYNGHLYVHEYNWGGSGFNRYSKDLGRPLGSDMFVAVRPKDIVV